MSHWRVRVTPFAWACVAVAVLAFAVRLSSVLVSGGLRSSGRYDDAVYYAAADALTFGRVPYHEFVLLHPPGITLVLAPFALLGRMTSDHVGMDTARLAFMALGALNAVLVMLIARRWGRAAALAGGIAYACWQPAVYAEQATLLEPVGTTLLLLALALLLRPGEELTRRRRLLAGLALGLCPTVKIWYVAPVAVILVWVLVARRWRAALETAAATAGMAAVVLLPFFALAPSRMWDMVVRDQFARSADRGARTARLSSIFGAQTFLPAHASPTHLLVGAIMVVVAVAAVVCLLLGAQARALVLLLATCLAVLLTGPTYFGHYAELAAAPIVLVGAVGLTHLGRLAPVRAVATPAAVLASLAALYAVVHVSGIKTAHPIAWARLDAVAPAGCLASDSPEPLIEMDRLSRDLSHGCPVPVDVGGLGYDLLRRVSGRLVYVSRAHNPAWQRFLYRYLVEAKAFVLIRGSGEIEQPYYRQLVAHRQLGQANGVVLRAGGAGT